MDKWLEALQKVAHETPAPAKSGPIVDSQFSDLIKISDDGNDISVAVTHQLYDGDAGVADVPHIVDTLFEKAQRDQFRIPEITPPHEDGIETERCGDQIWKFHWKDGRIVKSELWDPEQAGGYLCLEKRDLSLDGLHNATARFASPAADLETLDSSWEELLGSSAYPEKRPEISSDSKKKKAAGSETFIVDGKPLAKSELTSRMFRVLEQIRSFCQGGEAALLEKSIKALDLTAFAELAEPVLARMKNATEFARSH